MSKPNIIRIAPGQTCRMVISHSEVAMHMRVAGKLMTVRLLENGAAQLYGDKKCYRCKGEGLVEFNTGVTTMDECEDCDGIGLVRFSFPILASEAGILADEEGHYYHSPLTMRIEAMDPIPPGSNPYSHDLYHMGVPLHYEKKIDVMFDQRLEYLIIVNRQTGERAKVIL